MNRILKIQIVMHIVVMVIQLVFLINESSLVYGLIIPILIHLIIGLFCRDMLSKEFINLLLNSHSKSKEQK